MRAIVRTDGYRWVLVNGEVTIDDEKDRRHGGPPPPAPSQATG
jgi:hypothetical protein